ncbi:MAG: hypothetical protein AAGA58_04105 [Verrucomicrobiota bacterium]
MARDCHFCRPEHAALQDPEAEAAYGYLPAEGQPLPKAEFVNVESHVRGGEPYRVEGAWVKFGCPHCKTMLRLRVRDTEDCLVDCPSCGLEIIPPDLEEGTQAELSRASAAKIEEEYAKSFRPGAGSTEEVDFEEEDEDEDDEGFEEWDDEDLDIDLEGFESAAEDDEDEEDEKEIKRAVKALRDGQVSSAFKEFDTTELMEPITWEDDEALNPDAKPVSSVFPVAMIGGAVVGLLAIIGWFFGAFSGTERADRKLAAKQESAVAEQTRFLGEVGAIVERDSWRDMLTDVRHPDRVESLMAEYYQRMPHEPVNLVSVAEPKQVKIGSTELWQAVAKDEDGQSRFVALEKRPDGWRLDWEAFVDLARQDWMTFNTERPVTPTMLRVIMCRCALLDSHLAEIDFPSENALGVRIWQRNREESLVAVVDRKSFLGWQIEENLLWDAGALFIVEASFPMKSEARDLVQLDRLIQRRWIYGVDDSGLKVDGGTSTAARIR